MCQLFVNWFANGFVNYFENCLWIHIDRLKCFCQLFATNLHKKKSILANPASLHLHLLKLHPKSIIAVANRHFNTLRVSACSPQTHFHPRTPIKKNVWGTLWLGWKKNPLASSKLWRSKRKMSRRSPPPIKDEGASESTFLLSVHRGKRPFRTNAL